MAEAIQHSILWPLSTTHCGRPRLCSYIKTYVHRAGRTARAGARGTVYSLLRHEDVRHFKDMLRKADNTYVKASGMMHANTCFSGGTCICCWEWWSHCFKFSR